MSYVPKTWMQEKVLSTKGYTPYCGNSNCKVMPRTYFNGNQFQCSCCGWISSFPEECMKEYAEINDLTYKEKNSNKSS